MFEYFFFSIKKKLLFNVETSKIHRLEMACDYLML